MRWKIFYALNTPLNIAEIEELGCLIVALFKGAGTIKI